MVGKMQVHAVGVVGHERTARAAFLPSRRKHEMLHHELRPSLEKAGKRARAVKCIEDVVLLDAFPRQGEALAGDTVAQVREFLFLLQQVPPGGEPVFM